MSRADFWAVAGICLDAAAIRDELRDAGHLYEEEDIVYITDLEDNALNEAIHDVVSDAFWFAFDAVREAAINRLIQQRKAEEAMSP